MERDHRQDPEPAGMVQQVEDPPDSIAFQQPRRQGQPDDTADERTEFHEYAAT